MGKEFLTKNEELLTGTGWVCAVDAGGSGVLDVDLVMEPDSPDPKKWKLRFIKTDEGRELTD